MKSIITFFTVLVCMILIFPLSGNSSSSDGKIVTQMSNLVATGSQSQMETALEELSLKALKCKQLENKTPEQAQLCQEFSNAITVLEQALNQD